ncbi:TetR/AcrR family transcriptional regulator [Rhizobium sp. BR 314]|uniref:TetR/AcrR family transcriptional regulator n=1 Tax=Rhizobium sp. BR 314 TaxID=3040013 RepID=UPI0039BF8440
MIRRKRWSGEGILDVAAELLKHGDAETFSVRRLAASLGTDASSLYRHFRNKTELLRAVGDRVLLSAMEDYRFEGDWKQRIADIAHRLREKFAQQPQLATVWARYASSGAGSRAVMEALLRALQETGLPDERICIHYHRTAVLLSALIAADGGISTLTREERQQGMELFRVAVLGAAPGEYPALAHFARDLHPIEIDRQAAFAALLAGHLNQIQQEIDAR